MAKRTAKTASKTGQSTRRETTARKSASDLASRLARVERRLNAVGRTIKSNHGAHKQLSAKVDKFDKVAGEGFNAIGVALNHMNVRLNEHEGALRSLDDSINSLIGYRPTRHSGAGALGARNSTGRYDGYSHVELPDDPDTN